MFEYLLFIVDRLQDTIPLSSFQQRARPSRFTTANNSSPQHRVNQLQLVRTMSRHHCYWQISNKLMAEWLYQVFLMSFSGTRRSICVACRFVNGSRDDCVLRMVLGFVGQWSLTWILTFKLTLIGRSVGYYRRISCETTRTSYQTIKISLNQTRENRRTQNNEH